MRINQIKAALRPNKPSGYRMSFSQQGEDMILLYLFGWMQIEKPTYLDIGAHHPSFLSNTYALYLFGSRGVCVEPDPTLAAAIKAKRPGDTVLSIGVGTGKRNVADFYIMDPPTLNTFSKKEAQTYLRHYKDARIVDTVKTELIRVGDIIKDNFDTTPNLISIDIEGMDYEVLRDINLNEHRPEVFCIETIGYTGKKDLIKRTDIHKYMLDNNYFPYADTLINTIYVDSRAWKARKLPVVQGL